MKKAGRPEGRPAVEEPEGLRADYASITRRRRIAKIPMSGSASQADWKPPLEQPPVGNPMAAGVVAGAAPAVGSGTGAPAVPGGVVAGAGVVSGVEVGVGAGVGSGSHTDSFVRPMT